MKGFVINDCDSLATIIDASIYRFVFEELVVLKKKNSFPFFSNRRISYVTVSKTHKKIYAFIYQNPITKLIECHAFDCKSKNYVCIFLLHFSSL